MGLWVLLWLELLNCSIGNYFVFFFLIFFESGVLVVLGWCIRGDEVL